VYSSRSGGSKCPRQRWLRDEDRRLRSGEGYPGYGVLQEEHQRTSAHQVDGARVAAGEEVRLAERRLELRCSAVGDHDLWGSAVPEHTIRRGAL